ncbi:ORF34 [Agrotis segetum granulovirus]|uniref:ORF34 n=1 Tax=Agrotis segetum granulosis virus TaxID=10464 RepID=Q6QXF3_GVAS|nr:hypothetical protein AsGV038 [Agrotis segetum granulovirus]AAS82704.1 ORF34 [Agrotis segetum granulovirus]AHN92077.1 hypothetical protein AsGV038 [Agrotis segetum granulovirus]AKN63312.1 hypothetical protein AsGV038 [Agrotis segetum granulovirus]
MHQPNIIQLLKVYKAKCNILEDRVYELQQQYDKTQYELKCVKELLAEICEIVAPHRKDLVDEMIENHGRRFRTEHLPYGQPPLANLKYKHQTATTNFAPSSPTIWANLMTS